VKIVHLITSLHGGGTENFLFQILSRSPQNISHRVFFLKEEGVYAPKIRSLGIPVEPAGGALTFLKRLKENRPDVLHTCLYRAHQWGRVVGRLAGVPKIVSSQQSIDLWQKPWHRAADAFTLRFCDAVIANSRAAEALVKKRIGDVPRPQIFMIENGVEPATGREGKQSEIRSRYGIPADAVVGGSLMRLHFEKGADLIPAWAENVLTQWPALHLLVGGVGPLAQKLKASTANKPWSPRLHWLGWQEDRQTFLRALDFFWLLSREESFPQSLVEASSAGLPWIAPEIGGVPELLAAGATGFLYKPGDVRAAAEKVLKLHSALNALKTRAEQESFTLQGRYSVDKMAQLVYSVFREH
jgi:glycosyltransferase involved in cell wall biosynthesis